jgi:uncharacterized OB-fold protein
MSIEKEIIERLKLFTESLEADTVRKTHRITTLFKCPNCGQIETKPSTKCWVCEGSGKVVVAAAPKEKIERCNGGLRVVQ